MININKPANFYWEYTCWFTQSAGGVTINQFNNNTLATVTASKTNTGYAVFTFSSPILILGKVYLYGSSFQSNITPAVPSFFQYLNLTADTVTIRQFDSTGAFFNGFSGYLIIRIYP